MNPIAAILDYYPALVIDGALATELERRGYDLKDSLWSAKILLEQPDAIKQLHFDYFTAGADCAITASYQATITAFANQYAPWIGPISLILFTVLGAMWIARRVETAIPLHGVILGALASLVNIIFDGLSLNSLLTTILTIAAGWLGSQLSARK